MARRRIPIERGELLLLALACAALCATLLAVSGLGRQHAAEPAGARMPVPAATVRSEPTIPLAPRWQPRTPGQLRDLVRFCRDAGVSDVPELRQAALGSPDPLVAGNALRALGRLRAVARDPELCNLVHDPRLRVRQEAVMALGRSDYEPAVVDLALLLERRDPELRPLVIQALAGIGGARARTLLDSALRDASTSAVDRAFAQSPDSTGLRVPGPDQAWRRTAR